MRVGDWGSMFRRLEELVLANSGEDEFEEIFKLLIAKLVSEIESGSKELFQTSRSPQDTAQNVN